MLVKHGDIPFKKLANAIITDRGGQKRDEERSIVMDECAALLARQAQSLQRNIYRVQQNQLGNAVT